MKQIKPSERNWTIAEILEPKPEVAGYDRHTQAMASKAGCWRTTGYARGWQPLDFLHDPRGTVMLIEWLISRGFNVATLNGNLLQVLKQTCNPVIHVLIPFKQVIGPAVAYAFLRANGYEVSE